MASVHCAVTSKRRQWWSKYMYTCMLKPNQTVCQVGSLLHLVPYELCYTDRVVALRTSDPGTNECGRRVQWNLSMCSSVPRDVLPPERVCYGRLSYKAFSCSASSSSWLFRDDQFRQKLNTTTAERVPKMPLEIITLIKFRNVVKMLN